MHDHVRTVGHSGRGWVDSCGIRGVFASLDLQAMTFSESSAPWELDRSSGHTDSAPSIPLKFGAFSDAQLSIIEIARSINWLGETFSHLKDAGSREFADAMIRLDTCRSAVQDWHSAFSAFRSTLAPENMREAQRNQHATTMLEMCYTFVKAVSAVGFGSVETSWDGAESDWRHFLDLAETLPFMSKDSERHNPGGSLLLDSAENFVMPLYMIGHRCRDPALRRRVRAMLYSVNRKEGVWESQGLARVLDFIIDVEEDGRVVQRAADIPSWKRVRAVQSREDPERGQREVIFYILTTDGVEDDVYEVRTAWLDL
ncbi:hypothetical protein M8818_002663 [Zalaria obscura]|uniref:Uncharacterized protein n=1 Tax=Zalaria obscura TaxID=2024903 RepID=A0ACC3SJN3_9PEZI